MHPEPALDLEDLLAKTSRTFALAIPMLPEPTRRTVSLAYLLFRVLDTFEDASCWPRTRRLEALADVGALFSRPPRARAERLRELEASWRLAPPVTHAGYLELVSKTGALFAAVEALPDGARRLVEDHARRTGEGMARVVTRADEDGCLRLESVRDLEDYSYVVAGIVGELLTRVFVLDTPSLAAHAETLERHMVAFGEGLQLVNILKDAHDDARDGRVYLPPGLSRGDALALAHRDLDAAGAYVRTLQRGGAPRGYLAFTGTALVLARASLERLEAAGPGAKVSRADVARLLSNLEAELDAGGELTLG